MQLTGWIIYHSYYYPSRTFSKKFWDTSTTKTTYTFNYLCAGSKTWMSKLQFTPTWLTSRQVNIPKTNFDSEYIFVRDDVIRKSLRPCYQDPYKVIRRAEKLFTIMKNGKNDSFHWQPQLKTFILFFFILLKTYLKNIKFNAIYLWVWTFFKRIFFHFSNC